MTRTRATVDIYLFALGNENIVPTRACKSARLTRVFRIMWYEPQAVSRITAHSIRAGSVSCAFHEGVQTAINKRFADCSQSSLVFERDYFDVSYTRHYQSSAWYADLATQSPATFGFHFRNWISIQIRKEMCIKYGRI